MSFKLQYRLQQLQTLFKSRFRLQQSQMSFKTQYRLQQIHMYLRQKVYHDSKLTSFHIDQFIF